MLFTILSFFICFSSYYNKFYTDYASINAVYPGLGKSYFFPEKTSIFSGADLKWLTIRKNDLINHWNVNIRCILTSEIHTLLYQSLIQQHCTIDNSWSNFNTLGLPYFHAGKL